MENFEKIKKNLLAEKVGNEEFLKQVYFARRLKVPVNFSFDISDNGENKRTNVTRLGIGELDTPFGKFLQYTFEVDDQWKKYTAIIKCDGIEDKTLNPIITGRELILRTDSGCETGQLFLDKTCECREQLHKAMQEIGSLQAGKSGMIIHIPNQDGRGMGLPHKLATLHLQNHTGVDTVKSGISISDISEIDIRTYNGVIAVLKTIGINSTIKINLLTNNPKKTSIFTENGFDLTTKAIVIPATEATAHHLQAKGQFLGHTNLMPYDAESEICDMIKPQSLVKKITQVELSFEGDVCLTQETQKKLQIRKNIDNLMANMQNSLACVGLDPDIEKIYDPLSQLPKEEQVLNFLKMVIDNTNQNICAFKMQKAFFDELDGGHKLMKDVVAYAHEKAPNIPVIMDCKIGDIDNTMRAYIRNILVDINADGVLVNPYMGDDVFEELNKYPDKLVCVLAKTSNRGSEITQDVIMPGGKPYWLYILNLAMTRWNENGNIVPILSSVENKKWLVEARKIIPQTTPILFAGVGAQGRDSSDLSYLLNQEKSGVFVNSSRGIIFAPQKEVETKEEAVKRSCIELKEQLNTQRKQHINQEFNPQFLVLSGVSGVGKSTIMRKLKEKDSRFCYISPDITRPLREGETEKNYVTVEELRKRNIKGEYLAVNQINGIYYATPKKAIEEALARGQFPILDFPIEQTDIIKNFINGNLVNIYLYPESQEVLQERLSRDSRDIDGRRLQSGLIELTKFNQGVYDRRIDEKVLCETGKEDEITDVIYQTFMKKVHSPITETSQQVGVSYDK